MAAILLLQLVCVVLLTPKVYTIENTGLSPYKEPTRDVIVMSENLTEIPMGNAEVEFLNAAYNQISDLPDSVFVNKSYRIVQKLYLQRNRISRINVNAFRGLKQLKILDLSDNDLSTLDPYTFKSNSNLEKLILMNNRITFDRLQTFLISHSVESLVLSNNQITEIYGLTFLGVPNLKRLILSDNELVSLAPISFKSLGKLHYLSLANTGVHSLTQSMFLKLPRIINLENTPLAKRFEPPLTQVTNEEGIVALLQLHEFVY